MNFLSPNIGVRLACIVSAFRAEILLFSHVVARLALLFTKSVTRFFAVCSTVKPRMNDHEHQGGRMRASIRVSVRALDRVIGATNGHAAGFRKTSRDARTQEKTRWHFACR